MQKEKTVRAVFFDAVGTLIHPEPAAAIVYAEMGRRFGSRHGLEEISRRFRAAFAAEEAADQAAGFRTREARELERLRSIVAEILDDVADPESCFQELYQHFARPQAWRLEPAAADVISQLDSRGLILGLASNYDHRLRSVAAGFPELRLLKHLMISSELGWRKPAVAFFTALCRAVAQPPDRVLHVGDDPVNDCEGAAAAGLQTCLLDVRGRYPSFGGRRVASLREILS